MQLEKLILEINTLKQKLPNITEQDFYRTWEIIDEIFFNSRELMTLIKMKKEREKVSRFLFDLECLCIFFFNNALNFNFFIYTEISEIIKEYIEHFNYKHVFSKFNIRNLEYHAFVKEIKHIYSCFDKFLFINVRINKKLASDVDLEEISIKFTKDFPATAQSFLRSDQHRQELENYIKTLNRSDVFHYVRKFRNFLEHSYIDPSQRITMNVELKLLFILIIRTMYTLKKTYKKDSQLFEEIKQKSRK